MAKRLDWSAKQGRILTGGGRAEALYTAERGFPFSDDELPHYYLTAGLTREVFARWRQEGKTSPLVVGAWERPIFLGGWEHTTGEHDEAVFNLQTPSVFIDLRIPRGERKRAGSLKELTDAELRLFARQHAFAGYSFVSQDTTSSTPAAVCARHHAIDWNFVGKMRPRPNKWRIEPRLDQRDPETGAIQQWKEWSFARDEFGQHYYMELWSRLQGDAGGKGIVLALRKASGRDGMLIVVGDHFSYIFDRVLPAGEPKAGQPFGGCADVVDAALARGDRALAEAYLSLEAGHGRVAGGWVVDAALQPWQEGVSLPQGMSVVCEEGGRGWPMTHSGRPHHVHVQWLATGERWEIVECSLSSPSELATLLRAHLTSSPRSSL